ncbi:hypothetical protein ACSBR1_030971 [Camellia fascicularis]
MTEQRLVHHGKFHDKWVMCPRCHNILISEILLSLMIVKINQIVLSRDDSDASIRKRALELVYLLVNESNVKSLTKELIEYLEVSDQDFKGDLTAKICSIVEKFSTEKIWYIDQMLKVLSEVLQACVNLKLNLKLGSSLLDFECHFNEAIEKKMRWVELFCYVGRYNSNSLNS